MPSDLADFRTLLVKDLEKAVEVIFILDRDLRIVYCNEAWDRFSAENGGIGLARQYQRGRSIMEVVPAPLRRLYETGYREALSGRKWDICYECSSKELFRNFQMVVHPDPKGNGLIVVNSIRVELSHDVLDRRVCFPSEMHYVDDSGVITMCCHCRRTCRPGGIKVWDWVPAYVAEPPKMTSHGMCDVCMRLLYPDFDF
jgi:hypothetical protein